MRLYLFMVVLVTLGLTMAYDLPATTVHGNLTISNGALNLNGINGLDNITHIDMGGTGGAWPTYHWVIGPSSSTSGHLAAFGGSNGTLLIDTGHAWTASVTTAITDAMNSSSSAALTAQYNKIHAQTESMNTTISGKQASGNYATHNQTESMNTTIGNKIDGAGTVVSGSQLVFSGTDGKTVAESKCVKGTGTGTGANQYISISLGGTPHTVSVVPAIIGTSTDVAINSTYITVKVANGVSYVYWAGDV